MNDKTQPCLKWQKKHYTKSKVFKRGVNSFEIFLNLTRRCVPRAFETFVSSSNILVLRLVLYFCALYIYIILLQLSDPTTLALPTTYSLTQAAFLILFYVSTLYVRCISTVNLIIKYNFCCCYFTVDMHGWLLATMTSVMLVSMPSKKILGKKIFF